MPIPSADVELPEWAQVAALLAAGVVLAGMTDFLLARLGFPGVGAWVWAIGYGGTVLAVWFFFLRGQEFEAGGVAGDGSGDERNGERNR